MNKAFVRQDLDNVEVLGKEVPLSAVPEWANLEEAVTIINVKKPLFAYFKIQTQTILMIHLRWEYLYIPER